MKKIVILLLILFNCADLKYKTGTQPELPGLAGIITGQLLYEDNDEPLKGFRVSVFISKYVYKEYKFSKFGGETKTDKSGYFKILILSNGYQLVGDSTLNNNNIFTIEIPIKVFKSFQAKPIKEIEKRASFIISNYNTKIQEVPTTDFGIIRVKAD